jgi:phosphoribosyl 1,2-cyclic phosphate phosphodiesterase
MSASPSLKVTILGSGTSTGVPVIACSCAVCQGTNPYNKRLRSSILLSLPDNGPNIVVDTSTDFRSQMLSAKTTHLEYVLFTHTHADHCHGFDDLRAFFFQSRQPVNCYLSPEHLGELKERFSYAFQNSGYHGTAPQAEVFTFHDRTPFHLHGLEIDPVRLPHGHTHSYGFRFGNFAYATDFKFFPLEIIARWKGKIHTMVASGLHFRPHATHSSVPETIALFEQLEVTQGIITHLSHEVDYPRDLKKLPPHIRFAYDGMFFDVA